MNPQRAEPAHTPGPWNVEVLNKGRDRVFHIRAGRGIGQESIAEVDFQSLEANKANATHIVKCVNAHEALLETCKIAAQSFKTCGLDFKYLEDAIAKAEGKGGL